MSKVIQQTLWLCVIVIAEFLIEVRAPRPYINDEACPRKPELALNRKCLKKCRTDLDCKGRNRQCMCDDVCGKACVRPSQKCEQLKPIFHGTFEVDSNSHVFGARVKYECDKFYTLHGAVERVCQGDGYWSEKPPKCLEEDAQADHAVLPTLGKCQNPPQVAHAYHDGPRTQLIFPLGTQLNYRCTEGYNIDGFFRSMCVGDGRWVGPRMSCSPRRCGHPGDIQNGNREGNAFVYPNRVTYGCVEGFEMLGRSFRVCLANGKWSGSLPSCIPTKCPRLNTPTNGEMMGTDNTYGATVRFACTKGFDLKGSRTRRCEHSGKWSGETVSCTQVDCGQPGPFYNGFLDGGTTTYGSEYQFRCFGWTTFEGPSLYTTCQENGLWSHPVPNCWARCPYPSIVNGTIDKDEVGDEYATHGENLDIDCAAGHDLNTTDPAQCHNGTWTFVPECRPAPCNLRPKEIRNGYVRFYAMNHGDKARYKCNTGYELVGNEDVTCQYGHWLGSRPECAVVYCPFPGTIENGQLLLVGMIGKYAYRSYVKKIEHNQEIEFHCDKNYKRIGHGAATCVDGHWSPPGLPKCVPKQHPKILYLFRGKRSVASGVESTEVAELDETTPVDFGVNEDKGFCEVPTIVHGNSSSLPPGYYVPHDEVLEVTCDNSYILTPHDEAVRCVDGVWSVELQCESPYCPFPGTIENGRVLLVGVIGKYLYRSYVKRVRQNQVIEFECDTDFKRVGHGTATCVDGEWHPRDLPTCVAKQHPKILFDDVDDEGKGYCEVPFIAHVLTRSLPTGYYVPNSVALEVTCAEGYNLAPPGERDRCIGGVWSVELQCTSADLMKRNNEEWLVALASNKSAGRGIERVHTSASGDADDDATRQLERVAMEQKQAHAQR